MFAIYLLLLLISAVSATDVLKPFFLYDSSHAIEGVLSPLWEEHSLDPQHLAFALNLQDEELLAHAGEKLPTNEFTFAMMNLETSEIQKIINMQRFTTLLSDVKCGEPFTTITFQSRNAFEYAANAWDWVNSKADRVIQMIPSWNGCFCDQGSYRPFRFHKIEVDNARLTILLEGIELEWENAMHAFDMHITTALANGDTFISPTSTHFEIPEDFTLMDQAPTNISAFDDEKFLGIHLKPPKWVKKFHKVISKAHITISKGHAIYLNHYVNPGRLAVGNQQRGLSFEVSCISCHSDGSMNFALDIRWSTIHGIEKFGTSVTAVGVQFVTIMEARMHSTSVSTLEYARKIIDFPLPMVGYEIPNVFRAGFIAKIKFGLSIPKWNGFLGVTYGLGVTLPNHSGVYLDLIRSMNDHPSSFAPQIWHRRPEWKAGANGVVSFSLAAGIGLELALLKKYKYEAGVAIKAPVLKISLAIVKPRTNPCRWNHRAVAVDVTVGLALSWKCGKGGGDYSVTHPIGRRALLDGRAGVEDELRIPRALIPAPVGIEHPPTQDYLDHIMDEPMQTMTPSLDKRGTGWAVGMPIWHVDFTLIKHLCLWVNLGHRRDLGETLEQEKRGRKSIAF